MSKQIQISVRTLVEYVFRSGSIDHRFRTSQSMSEGTKAHQKIQSDYGELDQKEVVLRANLAWNEHVYVIEGRCDGILYDLTGYTIDEIKSTSTNLNLIEEQSYPVHWAQAKLYAYIFADKEGLKEIKVQLTYFQLETKELKRFLQVFRTADLEKFVFGVLDQYAPFAELMRYHQLKRDESIQQLSFPFKEFRAGQRRLAGAVYKTIQDKRNLFAIAPTGIGKTISTTFPAVKSMQAGEVDKLFYLTAKTITRQTAEEAFHLMKMKGLVIHTVTITAKEKACLKEKTLCQKDYCEFANGYYDRLNTAVIDILQNESNIDREKIEFYSKKHTLCPFEFSLDLTYLADVVICDYNYIFDPSVSLKRLFEDQKNETVLLVDEAHNLVDRAREMFSADIEKSLFLSIKRQYKDRNLALSRAAKEVNSLMLNLKKQFLETKVSSFEHIPEALVDKLELFREASEGELLLQSGQPTDEILLEGYFTVYHFLRIAKLYNERYITYIEIENDVRIKMFCVDPSFQLTQMTKGFRSRVYFSATLVPIDYYQNILGAMEEDYFISVPSPFNEEQTVFNIEPLSTRFKDRERTKEKIALIINSLIAKNYGNFLIFFPSYQYMMMVYEFFQNHFPEVEILLQNKLMTDEEREAFLEAFQSNPDKSIVGFAVLGGVFSEGVDLKGDRLKGVVVVGVGLPQIGVERELIKDYNQKKGKNGYDYAYVYPGLNKVLQAGGRLIRSEEDTGIILLIDDRFLENKYQRLLPQEWLRGKRLEID